MSKQTESKRHICFRFDVDTHKCASVGIPNLVRLGSKKNVRFTFFVNCGQAIDFKESLKALIKKKPDGPAYSALSPMRKLGLKEYLRCAIVNPSILDHYGASVAEAHKEGHEIGLHGGKNHERWDRFVEIWSEAEIREEIKWGIAKLGEMGIVPATFASPCAHTTPTVRRILKELKNFEFTSENLKARQFRITRGENALPDVPVSICGEGGVSYVEFVAAKGWSHQEIEKDFRERLREFPLQTVYDHPFFAGDEALPITELLIDAARSEGFEFVTLRELGRELMSYELEKMATC